MVLRRLLSGPLLVSAVLALVLGALGIAVLIAEGGAWWWWVLLVVVEVAIFGVLDRAAREPA